MTNIYPGLFVSFIKISIMAAIKMRVFLSVFTIVILSVFLRQKGSAQSKEVDASNDQTGD